MSGKEFGDNPSPKKEDAEQKAIELIKNGKPDITGEESYDEYPHTNWKEDHSKWNCTANEADE